MAEEAHKPLSEADKELIFRKATAGLPRRYADAIQSGITDEELESALADVLGIFGGSSRPDQLSISFTGSGLRIWGGWHIVNHVREPPLFAGKKTMEMARVVYGIANPDEPQLTLF